MASHRLRATTVVLVVIVIGCSRTSSTPTVQNSGETESQKHSAITPTVEPMPHSPGLVPERDSDFEFYDVASDAGIHFRYRNGEESDNLAVIENLGGGVAFLDFDNDGWQDVWSVGGGSISENQEIVGRSCGLWLNREAQFTNAASAAGVIASDLYTHGVSVLDADNDGFSDVLVTGFEGARLWMNCGDGTFAKLPSDALNSISGIATSCASADFNGDGNPDLYVCTYVDWSFASNHPVCSAADDGKREWCSPKDFKGTPDYLFFGDGSGDFLRAEKNIGLKENGKGLGVIASDLDQDGDIDLYVANDTTENFFYQNENEVGFREIGILSGTALDERALPNGSMGLSTCDVDQDGRFDLWVANYERESFAIYRNEGSNNYLHTSRNYGISALGGQYVGFGTDWEDFNADGIEEIIVTNGHVLRYPTGAPRMQKPLLLCSRDGRFQRVEFPTSSYFSGSYAGRGLAVGDFNRDGSPDVLISHINSNIALLRNDCKSRGQSLAVRLVGTQSTRRAEGVILELSTSAGQQLKTLAGGGSYLSSNEAVVRFGIPEEAKISSLDVRWPSGSKQSFSGSSLDGMLEFLVVEPNE